jgi:flagellar motor component MotA
VIKYRSIAVIIETILLSDILIALIASHFYQVFQVCIVVGVALTALLTKTSRRSKSDMHMYKTLVYHLVDSF